jgi:hypothetical protein
MDCVTSLLEFVCDGAAEALARFRQVATQPVSLLGETRVEIDQHAAMLHLERRGEALRDFRYALGELPHFARLPQRAPEQ